MASSYEMQSTASSSEMQTMASSEMQTMDSTNEIHNIPYSFGITNFSASSEFTWKIENFSNYNSQDGHCSGVFSLGSAKWEIQIYPKGNGEIFDHLSVYLQPRGLTEPVTTKFNFELTSQTDPSKTIGGELTNRFYRRSEEGYGWAEFLHLRELNQADNGYVVNDTCVVKVKVSCMFKEESDDNGNVKGSKNKVSKVERGIIKEKKVMVFSTSNNLVVMLNVISFFLSICILGIGIWLTQRDCDKFIKGPIIAFGVFMMMVSLAGVISGCCRVSWLKLVYLVLMIVLIVLLLSLTIFGFVVANKGSGQVISGRGYKEERLSHYSHWFQKIVSSQKNWSRIKSCLQDRTICKTLSEETNVNATQFFLKHLSPIQSGCCKPPKECGFLYKSATVWDSTGNTTSANSDCAAWKSAPSTSLCFDCQSCKAGVLANFKKNWKKVVVMNIIFLIFLFIVYSIGCCAFRNNREDISYPRWKGHA